MWHVRMGGSRSQLVRLVRLVRLVSKAAGFRPAVDPLVLTIPPCRSRTPYRVSCGGEKKPALHRLVTNLPTRLAPS